MATENVGGIEYTVDANVRPVLDANNRLIESLNRLNDNLEDTSEAAEDVDTSMTVAAKGVKKAVTAAKQGAIAMTAFAASMTAIAVAAAEAGSDLERLARISNTSVERFQELAAGAKQVGVDTEMLGSIFQDTQDKVGDFLSGEGGELVDYFENVAPLVGQTADEFRDLSGPDALIKFQQGLDAANLSMAEQVFYLESIASDSILLRPLLKDNAAGFKAAAKEAREMNLVLSQSEVSDLKEVNKEWNKLLNVIAKSTQKIVAEHAPEIIKAFQQITEIVLKSAEVIGDFMDSFSPLDERLVAYDKQINSVAQGIIDLAAERDKLNAFDPDDDEAAESFNKKIEEQRMLLRSLIRDRADLERELKKPLVIEVKSGAGQESQPKSKPLAPLAVDKSKPISIFDTEEGGTGMVELNEELAESLSLVDQLSAKFDDLGGSLTGVLTDSVLSFTDSLGQGMAQAIVDGDNLEDTFRNIAGTIGTQLLGSLITLGLQYGINAALKSTADATETASGVAAAGVATAAGVTSATTLATAYAPAATAASIATFGAAAVTGTAAMTTAYATGNALALSGGRQNGGPVSAGSAYQVTEDGKPEMLTVGGKNILMMGNQSGTVTKNGDLGSAGGGGVVVNINNNASGTEATATSSTQDGQTIIDVVVSNLNNRGKIHKAVTGTTSANNKTR